MRGIDWFWTDHARYVAFTESIQKGKNAAQIPLPGTQPVMAILSDRLVDMIHRMPDECRLDPAGIQASVAECCDHLHVKFAGVDLSRTSLVDAVPFRIGDGLGATWTLPVIALWQPPTFTIAAGSELHLRPEHYVDRWLLITELRHQCNLEE